MKKEWFEEWFDTPYYHVLYQNRHEEEARRTLDKLLATMDLRAGARVLDLACGRGRHAWYLSEKGYFVTGLDLSEQNIRFALARESERLEFFQHDMRRPFRSNYYDAVLNMFTSFGYFESDREHLLALRQSAANLRPGGWFLLDYFNSAWVHEHLVAREEKAIDEVHFLLKREISGNRVKKSIEIQDKTGRHSYCESVRLFTLTEFEEMFSAAGLTIASVFGDYDLHLYVPNQSPRLMLLARKNETTWT